jgi:hypothetical protein
LPTRNECRNARLCPVYEATYIAVEPRHHLIGLDAIADIDGSLDHASADAECQAGLVLGLDAPGECDSAWPMISMATPRMDI